jgi:hypothetical protein
MTTDLTIELSDTAGELARLGRTLGAAGVNIEGLCATTNGGSRATVHLLVDDAEAAFKALARAGIEVAADEEVMVVPVEDRPGVLGEIGSILGDAEVNVDLVYLATATRLVVGAADLSGARAALESH